MGWRDRCGYKWIEGKDLMFLEHFCILIVVVITYNCIKLYTHTQMSAHKTGEI